VAKKKEKEEYWDSVGWLFFAVWFVLLVGPCIYGLSQIVTEGTSALVPFAVGPVFAAVAAGLIAWAVNSVLQFRAKRRRIAARKKVRKR